MRGRVASLNASVAGSVLLFEAASQRGGVALVRQHQVADAGPVASRPVRSAEPRETAAASAEFVAGNEPGRVETVGQDAGPGMSPGVEPEGRNDAMPTAEAPASAEAEATAGPEPETAGEPGPDNGPGPEPLTAPAPAPDRPKRARRVRPAAIAAEAPTGPEGATDQESPERRSTRSPEEPTSAPPHEEDLLPELLTLPERAETATDAELEHASE